MGLSLLQTPFSASRKRSFSEAKKPQIILQKAKTSL
jgi:hypothetical protein